MKKLAAVAGEREDEVGLLGSLFAPPCSLSKGLRLYRLSVISTLLL